MDRGSRRSGKMTSSSSSGLESDVTDLTLDETVLTDRDYVLERFIDDYIGQEEGSRDERDLWQDGNSRTVVKLPPLKCSKYTVIGNPSMEKRRRRLERDEQSVWTLAGSQGSLVQPPPVALADRTKQTLKITATVRRKKGTVQQVTPGKQTLHQSIRIKGGVPELITDKTSVSSVGSPRRTTRKASSSVAAATPAPSRLAQLKTPSSTTGLHIKKADSKSAHTLRNNMEKNTLFETSKFRKLYMKIAEPKQSAMPGPLECSPRFQDLHLEVEPQLLQEKMLVLGDYLQTSRFQRYRQDRAVIPAGFPEAFRSKTFTRHVVTAMYVDEHEKKLQRERTRPSCIRRELSMCHYCDVIGNKYCKSCIENKNKWFGGIIERRPLPLSQKSLPLP